MKPLSVATALLVAVFTLSACSSSEPTSRSQQTVSSMDDVQEQLSGVFNQLDNTQRALDNVANSSPAELESAYDSFQEQVSSLQGLREDLNEQISQMQEEGDVYLSNWQSEAEGYSNEELRSDSRDRRDELRETFNEVGENTDELNQAIESYLSDVKEIESYLSNDLTQSGANAIGDSRQQERSAEDIRDAIEALNSSLQDAQEEMGARQRESGS